MNSLKGIWAEDQAIQHFKKQNWQLQKKRWKTQFGELDLLFQKSGPSIQVLGVEVKYLSESFDLNQRVSKAQIQRLRKINRSLSEAWKDFRLLVFLVNKERYEILGLEEFY